MLYENEKIIVGDGGKVGTVQKIVLMATDIRGENMPLSVSKGDRIKTAIVAYNT